jgi:hypothetical protein
MKGDKKGHRCPEQGAEKRVDRNQPVFPARPHVPQLGPGKAQRLPVQTVDPRHEGSGRTDRARPLPRRPAQPAKPRQADDRRACRRVPAGRPEIRTRTIQRPLLIESIALCEELQDYVSRDLLEELLEHCEEAIDWLETQQSLIENVTLPNYLQAHMERSGRCLDRWSGQANLNFHRCQRIYSGSPISRQAYRLCRNLQRPSHAAAGPQFRRAERERRQIGRVAH